MNPCPSRLWIPPRPSGRWIIPIRGITGRGTSGITITGTAPGITAAGPGTLIIIIAGPGIRGITAPGIIAPGTTIPGTMIHGITGRGTITITDTMVITLTTAVITTAGIPIT